MNKIAKGKGINLTPREPKKEDKYKETSDIKNEYKFSIESKGIYIGFNEEHRGQECTIIKRSTRKNTHYYMIKFDDNEELKDITNVFLKTFEEYEQWLLDQENDNENENDTEDISEIERKVLEAGLIPYHNSKSCLSPIVYTEMRCNECNYESRCIYHSKHNYKKVKF